MKQGMSCLGLLVLTSTASAVMVTYEDFEGQAVGTPSATLASGFLTAGGAGGGGGTPVAPTITITSPGLAGSTRAYQASHGVGTFNYNGDIPLGTLVGLDLSNPLLEVTMTYQRTNAGNGPYNTLRLIGNTDAGGVPGYGAISTDAGLGSTGSTIVKTWDLSAYLGAITSPGTYNNLRFVLNKNFDNTGVLTIDSIRYNAVPEPAAMTLAGLGGLALLTRRRGQH